MKEKSLEPKLFAQILKDFDDILFVSLQYGDPTPEIKLWKDLGVEVLHDPEVNALSDMDKWLSQVSICDAVISVANTTIHGAGGLDIPTKCLLSIFSDWRWFKDPNVDTSYWYPSVSIARQLKMVIGQGD